MAYRPVQMTERICAYCGDLYSAKDRRRMYCSSSCNTLACMARKEDTDLGQPEAATMPGQQLAFSLTNVATVAAGTLAADAVKEAGKALFVKRQPTNTEVMSKLTVLETAVKQLQGGVLTGLDASLRIERRQIHAESNQEPVKSLKQQSNTNLLL